MLYRVTITLSRLEQKLSFCAFFHCISFTDNHDLDQLRMWAKFVGTLTQNKLRTFSLYIINNKINKPMEPTEMMGLLSSKKKTLNKDPNADRMQSYADWGLHVVA